MEVYKFINETVFTYTGAVLLRSILALLRASARSTDVVDINLPLLLSDIPEAIQKWQTGLDTHVVYERYTM